MERFESVSSMEDAAARGSASSGAGAAMLGPMDAAMRDALREVARDHRLRPGCTLCSLPRVGPTGTRATSLESAYTSVGPRQPDKRSRGCQATSLPAPHTSPLQEGGTTIGDYAGRRDQDFAADVEW